MRAATALVILAFVVGSAGCSDGQSSTDEPTPSPQTTTMIDDAGDTTPTSSSVAESATTPETTTTTVPEPSTTTAGTTTTTIVTAESWTRPPLDGDWVEVAAGEPWGPALFGEIDALPGGGYVTFAGGGEFVAKAERDGFAIPIVMWSPDGVEWSDGDPEREIDRSDFLLFDVAGDQVVIVDGTDVSDHVSLVIGDPRTASWDAVALDYTALEGDEAAVEDISLAANNDEVLVLGGLVADDGTTTGVVTWVVNPTTGTWETNSIEAADGPTRVAWVDGRWILLANEERQRNALWTSSDGLVWSRSQADLPMQAEFVPSLAVGPMGVVATTCTGMGSHNEIWYSADGLEWDMVSQADGACYEATAVGDYGFVITGQDPEPLRLLAPDGSEVYQMPIPFEDEDWGDATDDVRWAPVAASSGDTLLVSTGKIFSGFWLYSPS